LVGLSWLGRVRRCVMLYSVRWDAAGKYLTRGSARQPCVRIGPDTGLSATSSPISAVRVLTTHALTPPNLLISLHIVADCTTSWVHSPHFGTAKTVGLCRAKLSSDPAHSERDPLLKERENVRF
jgi:hypothetical protein